MLQADGAISMVMGEFKRLGGLSFVAPGIALALALTTAACVQGVISGPTDEDDTDGTLYTVGGMAAGLENPVVISLNGDEELTLSTNGSFTFATELLTGAAYEVTLVSAAQACTIANGSGTVASSNVTHITVACDGSDDTFVVSGTVGGLRGSGLILQNNVGDDLTITAAGAFAFETLLAEGDAYEVGVLSHPISPAQRCEVANGTGIMGDGPVTDVEVHCLSIDLLLGGTISGATGPFALTVGTETLSISDNGEFTFISTFEEGQAYSVSVSTHPDNQVCFVDVPSGIFGSDSIETLNVFCTSAWSLGGVVAGLTGTGLILESADGQILEISDNGIFSFPVRIADGESFEITLSGQPIAPSQTCTLSNATGTATSDISDVVVDCVTNTYRVGGTVSGLTGSGLILQNNGGNNLSVTTNGSFQFSAALPDQSAYSVTASLQPTSPRQTCVVVDGTGSLAGSDVNSVAISCSTNTYPVRVSVSGLSATGLTLTNFGGDTLAVGSNGTSSFATPVADQQTYEVTIATQPTGQYCAFDSAFQGTVDGAAVDIGLSCRTYYNVGGTLSGLQSGSVMLRLNDEENVTVSANGGFGFGSNILDGDDFVVVVQTQPGGNQICSVMGGEGTINGANGSFSVLCSESTYTVGGTISGLTAGQNLVLRNNGGDNLIINGPSASFQFASPVAALSAYNVTVFSQPTDLYCLLSNGSGTVSGDVTNVSIACGPRYNIGVVVTGLASGNSVTLRNNGGNDLLVGSSALTNFTQRLGTTQPYNVTVTANPTMPNQTCTVSGGSGAVGASDVVVNVNCTTNTYSLGGNISGLAGGNTVRLGNGTNEEIFSANGSFTFSTPLEDGTGYTVGVASVTGNPSQSCVIANGSGALAGANVTNVSVTCSTNTFTVGGSVSGLADGNSVWLQNNSGNTLQVSANGAFAFSTALADLSAYNTTVLTNPTTPNQTCSVSNASGSLAGANVTNVTVACTTNTYSIGGTVSGLAGSGLVLRNNGGNDLAISANGSFTFSAPITDGTGYAVTVLTQPTSLSQTCTITSGSGTLNGSNVANVSVACTTNTYSVGGTVSGLAGSGLVLRNNGGNDLAISASGSFTFSTPISDGTGFTVTVLTQPTSLNQTCTVTNGSGTMSGSNITNIGVACVTTQYTIGGTVSGLAGSVVLQNNGGEIRDLFANGSFSFPTSITDGGGYNVTVLTQPGSPPQICTVTNGSGTVSGGNVTNISVACITTHWVGGSVSGLAGGTSVVLQINGGETTTVTSNTTFSFPTWLTDGSAYAVTVLTQPTSPNQTCSVSGGTGTLAGANVTNITVTCVTNQYTIGGTVSGLQPGTTLVLRNNGGDNLSVTADGSFTFATPQNDMTGYNVTRFTNPTNPNQTCTVSNGSGTLAGANVTSVSVSCVIRNYIVRASVTGLASGNSLVVQNDGGEGITINSTGFTNLFALPDHSSFNVIITTQPTGPNQTCVIQSDSGSGTLNGSNHTVQIGCTTNRYNLGGTVTGLGAGKSFVAYKDGANGRGITTNGPFEFGLTFLDGSTYTVTTTQPAGQTCTVTNGSGTFSGSDVTDVMIECTSNQFTVGGTVSGLAPGNSVVLQNNGANNLTVSENGAFAFPAQDDLTGYNVTVLTNPTSPSQTCTAASSTGTLAGANVTNVSVTCINNSYTIGGTVSGLAAGRSVVLQNNGGDNRTVSANGAFSFATAVIDEGSYNVTVLTQPSVPNQICTVTSGSGTVSGANVTNVSVNCVTQQYTVGGTVSGLEAGTTLVLQNFPGNELSITANGAYNFPAQNDATSYNVSVATPPTAPSQTCVVLNGIGVLSGSNVTNISITCSVDSFTIGGSIAGLATGNSATLQNNGGDNLTLSSNGVFSFTTPLLDLSSYNVTVSVQPTGPNQTCTVSDGSGTVSGSNVTSVFISCVTNQYTIGGTVSGLNGTGLLLRNNGGNNLSISADGSFTFTTALNDMSAYNVTVFANPTDYDQKCTVVGGSGTLAGSTVTGIAITCRYLVEPWFTGATQWMIYRSRSAVNDRSNTTNCTVTSGGKYAVCIHAGEMRTFFYPDETSCAGMSAQDNVGAFDWTCSTEPGGIRFRSRSLAPGMYLSDLLEWDSGPVAWKDMQLTVYDGATPVAQSHAEKWWTNTVTLNNIGGGLATTGTVFVVTSPTGNNYTVQARVALVVKPGVVREIGLTVSGVKRIVGIGPGSGQSWIEGAFDAKGESASHIIHATNPTATSIRVRGLTGTGFTGSGMTTSGTTTAPLAGSYFEDISLVGDGVAGISSGIMLTNGTHNTFRNVRIANCATGVHSRQNGQMFDALHISNAGTGIITNSDENAFTNVTISNVNDGIQVLQSVSTTQTFNNRFMGVTVVNAANTGVYVYNSAYNFFHNVSVLNSGTYGVHLDGTAVGSRQTFFNLAVSHSGTAGIFQIGTYQRQNIFTGAIKVGNSGWFNCDTADTNVGIHLVGGNCVATTPWSAMPLSATVTEGIDLSTSFTAMVTSNDTVNTSDTNGAATYSLGMDWLGFANEYRGWGLDHENPFPESRHQGSCNVFDTSCRIWDWSAHSTDLVARTTAALNSHGSDVLYLPVVESPGTRTVLYHAVEITGDHIGNDNGLCETGEACMYIPNMGAYQGHGSVIPVTFTNGILTGITLRRWGTNGR